MKTTRELFSLEGKVVLITGGASGIGGAISLRMADAGASVGVIYHGSETQAGELATHFEKTGVPHFFVPADLHDEKQAEKAVTDVAEHFGTIDVLVNNAGMFGLSMQEYLEVKDWDAVFDLNVRGLFVVTRTGLKHMSGPACSIVNISSINAVHPGFGQTAHYDASKGAVAAYTRSLAAELAPRRIRVNAVAPGLVDSESLRTHAATLADTVQKRTPLLKLASGDDVAAAVLFLASQAASHITGISLTVDGGYLLT